MKNNKDYNGIKYTAFEMHCFMSNLSGILHDEDVDWFDVYYEEVDEGDEWDDDEWESPEDFFDDDF